MPLDFFLMFVVLACLARLVGLFLKGFEDRCTALFFALCGLDSYEAFLSLSKGLFGTSM